MSSIEKPKKDIKLELYDSIPEGKVGDDIGEILSKVFGRSREEMEDAMHGRAIDSYLGVATEDGEDGEERAVGGIVFSLPKNRSNESGFIGAVAVSPDNRSIRTPSGEVIQRGRGIGTDLAQAAIKYMVDRGARRIEGERLPGSVGFWNSMGDAKVGPYGQEYVDVDPEHHIVTTAPKFEDHTTVRGPGDYDLAS